MAKLRAAIIGCGRTGEEKHRTGCGMGHLHAEGYNALPDVRLAALCDIVPAKAEAFRKRHGRGKEKIYADYRKMLARESLDLVSVCTWPALHAPMVIACAAAGVRAVHCEKPMALTWGDAKHMAAACEDAGVQLTFNHQRRFGRTFQTVRRLVEDKAIGELRRIEAYTGNLYDWGTHWFDMTLYFNGESPAQWLIGQIDPGGSHTIFGAPLEGQGLALTQFANGVFGLMCTGGKAPHDVEFRLLGSEGVIELGPPGEVGLRIMGKGRSGWEVLDEEPPMHESKYVTMAIADMVECLDAGREPQLSARRALQATELIFATYESSRRGARVDLPLDVNDSPIAAVLAARGRSKQP